MRDYLYLWHDPLNHRVVASGIQFADVVQRPRPADGGTVLLTHQHEDCLHDSETRLEYVNEEGMAKLCEEDMYCWGDICWADFAGLAFPVLSKESVAELLYFNHAKEPLREVSIPGLGNRYLATAHDDGWCLIFYYSHWQVITELLSSLPLPWMHQGGSILESREHAVWIDKNGAMPEEPTLNIDAVLKRHL